MNSDLRDDPALETLLRVFSTGELPWPEGEVLFLRARNGAALRSYKGLVCQQSFKPDADSLNRAGLAVTADVEGLTQKHYPLVLVLPPRQREELRATLARAMRAAAGGGRVVVAATNQEGARSLEEDLAQLAGSVSTITKNKSRACWTEPLSASTNTALVDEWLKLDAVREIAGGVFVSRPGVFAWDRLDVGSALLAEQLPEKLSGTAADLGCGFGYLSAALLERCPGIQSLDAFEAEHRALDLARSNLARYESRVPVRYQWHDVTTGLQGKYDVIVTNPPFHAGTRESRPQIGQQFIAAAAAALNNNGRLWLVANRQMPYESVLNAGFNEVRTVIHKHGFKIFEAIKSRPRVART
jgi:16S rRNA (guanine1207-N2)-methyltransferase